MATKDHIIFETNTEEETNALIAFGKALKLKFKITNKEVDESANLKYTLEIPDWHTAIVAERLEDYRKNPENAKNFDELIKNKREKYNL